MAKEDKEINPDYAAAADWLYKKYLTKDYEWEKQDFDLLTTMRYDPGLYEGELPLIEAIHEDPLDVSLFFLLDNHVRRINEGRKFFGFDSKMGPLTREILLRHITEAMKNPEIDRSLPQRIRLLVSKEGQIHLDLPGPIDFPLNLDFDCPVTFSARIDKDHTLISPFTSFKTTNRTAYNSASRRTVPEGVLASHTDVVLFNTAGNVTESSFCNVAFTRSVKDPLTGKESNHWVTPPLSSGCIEGTFRKSLVDQGLLFEQNIPVDSLRDGEILLLLNALRGILKATLVVPEGFE